MKLVITTTKVQSDRNGSVAVEPTFDMPNNHVDSLGDDKLANLAPKKKRRRGRPKQQNVVRRMDIVLKKPDMIRKPKPKRKPALTSAISKPIERPIAKSEDNSSNKAPASIINKPVAEVPIITSNESVPTAKSGLLIDSPVRLRNEITTHATASTRGYLPPSPLEGFNEVASDIETDSKAPISRLLI